MTITHLVGKATANALAAAPTLNGKILFYKFVPFDTVDVTFLVALEGGSNLGKVKIDNANEKSVVQIAAERRAAAEKMKSGKDPAWEKSKGVLKVLPGFVLRPMIRMTGWLASALGLNIPALGVERHAFGSCIITSVGMLGFDEGYAPFTPFARVPILLLVGAIRDTPSVFEGEICVRKKITVTATVDHRFIDGFQVGVLAKEFRAVLEQPFQNLMGLEDAHLIEAEDALSSPPVSAETTAYKRADAVGAKENRSRGRSQAVDWAIEEPRHRHRF